MNSARGGAAGDPAGDPDFANVVLLSHFDGADGSTAFVDVTGKTLTRFGNVQIDTAQSKFGGSSCLFDGTGDALTAADSVDWEFGSGAFTIELFARLSTKTTSQAFVSWISNVIGTDSSFGFYINGSGLLQFRYFGAGGNVVDVAVSWTPTLGVWYHVCAERNASGRIRIYVDGVMLIGSNGHTQVLTNSSRPLAIGSYSDPGTYPTVDFNGWMDELRITKGVARYNSDAGFAVPTAAYPDA